MCGKAPLCLAHIWKLWFNPNVTCPWEYLQSDTQKAAAPTRCWNRHICSQTQTHCSCIHPSECTQRRSICKLEGWFLFHFLKEKEQKKKKKEGVGETDRRWLSWADIFWEPVLRLPGAIFKRPTSPHCLVDVGERKGVYACKNIQLTQTHVPLQTARGHAVHTNTCAEAQAEGSHS